MCGGKPRSDDDQRTSGRAARSTGIHSATMAASTGSEGRRGRRAGDGEAPQVHRLQGSPQGSCGVPPDFSEGAPARAWKLFHGGAPTSSPHRLLVLAQDVLEAKTRAAVMSAAVPSLSMGITSILARRKPVRMGWTRLQERCSLLARMPGRSVAEQTLRRRG
jgi:hypothetical protein